MQHLFHGSAYGLAAASASTPGDPFQLLLRVMVWRRMRQIGALGLQNGVWILPARADLARWFDGLHALVRQQRGRGIPVSCPDRAMPRLKTLIRARFCAERDEEYAEFWDAVRIFWPRWLEQLRRRNSPLPRWKRLRKTWKN